MSSGQKDSSVAKEIDGFQVIDIENDDKHPVVVTEIEERNSQVDGSGGEESR